MAKRSKLASTCVQIWSRPKWAQVIVRHWSQRKACPTGVASRPRFSTCDYLQVFLARAINYASLFSRHRLCLFFCFFFPLYVPCCLRWNLHQSEPHVTMSASCLRSRSQLSTTKTIKSLSSSTKQICEAKNSMLFYSQPYTLRIGTVIMI